MPNDAELMQKRLKVQKKMISIINKINTVEKIQITTSESIIII